MQTSYRVAAVAELSGVTVRTLHHYDEIGLLKPSNRTQSGHRLYSDTDMLRLQQILTLRHLGFSLNEIHTLLESPDYDLQQSLEAQKQSIDEQIRGLQDVSEALSQAIEAAAALKQPNMELVGAVIRGLRASDESVQWLRQHYSDSAQAKITPLHSDMSVGEVAAGVEAWSELYAAFATVKHLPPEHPEVQKHAAKMHHLITQFTQGDPEIESSLRRVYADRDQMPEEFQMGDKSLFLLMNNALDIYRKSLRED